MLNAFLENEKTNFWHNRSCWKWSFETTKHITTGDGGIVTTNNNKLGINMRRFGSAGYKNLKANIGKIRIDKLNFKIQIG